MQDSAGAGAVWLVVLGVLAVIALVTAVIVDQQASTVSSPQEAM